MTCMTPRALAEETMALLKPLSCQAIADASAGETPCWAAIAPIWPEVILIPVGCGGAVGAAAPPAAVGLVRDCSAGEPVGSLRTRPATSLAFGDRPLA